MDYDTNFDFETKNNLPLKEYVEKISSAFRGEIILDKHIFGNSRLEDDDFLVLNHRILKRDFYLDINFVLGSHKQYLKLNCNVFAKTKEEIIETKNKLEEICGIENGN